MNTLTSDTGFGPTAWRLMNPSYRSHLFSLLDNQGADLSLSCSRFQPSVADAYCYYASSLGRTHSIRALRAMVLLEKNQNLDSRVKCICDQLMKATGRSWKQWELWSLEAYLLSPLFGPRPKLVRVSQAKQATAYGAPVPSPCHHILPCHYMLPFSGAPTTELEA